MKKEKKNHDMYYSFLKPLRPPNFKISDLIIHVYKNFQGQSRDIQVESDILNKYGLLNPYLGYSLKST